jgi:hypothetical protein
MRGFLGFWLKGERMLTLWSDRTECLSEESLPVEVKELPDDLAALDGPLSDPAMLGPIVERWRRKFRETGRFVLTDGRPTGGRRSRWRSTSG